MTGLRALRKVADDERRQTVIGMSLLLGIALPKALSGLTGGASVFFGNNIMVGVFSAIILNALFSRSSGFGGEASCAGVRGCSSSRSGGWDWRCGVR